MQTKKKNPARSAAREHVSPRVSRAQQKVSENVQAVEVKVKDLITSSARKQRLSKLLSSYLFIITLGKFSACLYGWKSLLQL
jgi:hypothetical protein